MQRLLMYKTNTLVPAYEKHPNSRLSNSAAQAFLACAVPLSTASSAASLTRHSPCMSLHAPQRMASSSSSSSYFLQPQPSQKQRHTWCSFPSTPWSHRPLKLRSRGPMKVASPCFAAAISSPVRAAVGAGSPSVSGWKAADRAKHSNLTQGSRLSCGMSVKSSQGSRCQDCSTSLLGTRGRGAALGQYAYDVNGCCRQTKLATVRQHILSKRRCSRVLADVPSEPGENGDDRGRWSVDSSRRKQERSFVCVCGAMKT